MLLRKQGWAAAFCSVKQISRLLLLRPAGDERRTQELHEAMHVIEGVVKRHGGHTQHAWLPHVTLKVNTHTHNKYQTQHPQIFNTHTRTHTHNTHIQNKTHTQHTHTKLHHTYTTLHAHVQHNVHIKHKTLIQHNPHIQNIPSHT